MNRRSVINVLLLIGLIATHAKAMPRTLLSKGNSMSSSVRCIDFFHLPDSMTLHGTISRVSREKGDPNSANNRMSTTYPLLTLDEPMCISDTAAGAGKASAMVTLERIELVTDDHQDIVENMFDKPVNVQGKLMKGQPYKGKMVVTFFVTSVKPR